MKQHKYIRRFNPCVEVYNYSRHKGFLNQFDCGKYEFNSYISGNEAKEDIANGDGVTYLVFNQKSFFRKELVAFYTLLSTSIPFWSRIKLDEDEIIDGNEYNNQLYGVNAVQIKMFAVDKKYQNKFFKLGEFDMPIAAWILRSIIDQIDDWSDSLMGIKAIFLHSAIDAENFYKRNGFDYTDEKQRPFDSEDYDLAPMFFQLREINIVYDE